jgi:hypothetical protein
VIWRSYACIRLPPNSHRHPQRERRDDRRLHMVLRSAPQCNVGRIVTTRSPARFVPAGRQAEAVGYLGTVEVTDMTGDSTRRLLGGLAWMAGAIAIDVHVWVTWGLLPAALCFVVGVCTGRGTECLLPILQEERVKMEQRFRRGAH